MLDQPEVSIVIPTLNVRAKQTDSCLLSIKHNTFESPYEIIIVDNGTFPQGYTAPVNSGVRAARGDYIVVMNDDVLVTPDWWEPLKDALDDGVSVVFPETIKGWMRYDFAAWCFAFKYTDRSIRVSNNGSSDIFDEQFKVWFQDTDLFWRLKSRSELPLLIPDSKIAHELSTSLTRPDVKTIVEEEIKIDWQKFQSKWDVGDLEELKEADNPNWTLKGKCSNVNSPA